MNHFGNLTELELLKAAIESANDAVIITDTELDPPGPKIVYVNPAFTRMTGYTYEEIIGKNPRLLQGPRTSKELTNRLRYDLQEKREFYGETFNYRKDRELNIRLNGALPLCMKVEQGRARMSGFGWLFNGTLQTGAALKLN